MHEQSISTDPRTVWAVISDLDRWDQMLPTIDEVSRLGQPGPITVGTRFEVRQPGLPAAEYVVTDWRPGDGFTWATTGMGSQATATHEVETEGSGTRLRLGIEWTGPTAWLMRALISRRARSYLAQEAQTFARLAASQKSPG